MLNFSDPMAFTETVTPEEGFDSRTGDRFVGGFERESRNYHFNALLRSMLGGYWEWELASNHFFASPSLKSLLGMRSRGAVNVDGRCPEFIAAEDTRRWRQAVTRLLTNRRGDSVEETKITCLDAKKGNRPTLLRMCVIDRDTRGTPLRLGGCFLDFGAIAGEQTETQKPEAGGPMKFISAVAHEIRTPLMSILGTTQLLREENPRDDQVENLESLRFAGSTLLSLVNDVLDLSKVEIGKLVLEESEFSIESIASSVLDSFSFQKRRKALSFPLEIKEGIPPTVLGDPNRLSQILFNLVGNAVKFTERGTVRVRVAPVTADAEKVTVRIDVSDTGMGIAKEHMSDLFEPFGTASAKTGRVFGGSGLGLAITKRLIEMQGGRITCESSCGRGTVFSVEIPYKVPDPKNGNRRWQNPFRFRALSGRVLLVEDNPVIAKIARKFLEKWQIDVRHSPTGEEALEEIQKQDFDIALMDLQLPGISGWETSRRIREMEDGSGKRLPIITMTASVPENSRERMRENGIDDLLLKPVHPQRMYQMLARHLSVRV